MKSWKRNIFLVLIFAMLLTILCVLGVSAETYADDATAVAAGAVARVGDAGTGTYYSSLPDAIAAAPEGATVTLIADTSFSDSIAITKTLTLNGTGTITFTGAGTEYTDETAHAFNVSAAVNFTVNGNVTLTSATAQHVLIHITAAANVTVGGNAKLTVTGSSNRSYVILHTGGAGATVTICDNANLAATGGRTVETTRGQVTFRMTGGTVGGSYGFLFVPDEAFASAGGTASLFEVTGGKIDAGNNPFHLDGADNSAAGTVTLKISNCTLNCKGSTNACIRTYAGTNIAVEIGNGTVMTSSGHGIYAGSDTKGTVTMTGGSVTASSKGFLIESTASITFSMTGGAISAPRGIHVSSKGVCRLELLGGSVTGTGSTDAAVWLNPVGNTQYTDLTLIVDGATLAGGYYAVCCQGYGSSAAIAYMTVIVKESDSAKPTVLKSVTENAGARTIRMVDGSQVDLQISGGTISTTAKGDSLIYGSNVLGYTKLTLSGGNFTPGTTAPTHVFLNLGRTMDVILSGSFNTGEGQTGSISKAATSLFCQGSVTGATNITTTADITASNVIFRCQLGTMNVTINGGKLSSTTTISYTTYANGQGGISNITINGGELTTNNKANMFDARAGEMNIYVYGGIIRDGNYLFSYRDFDSATEQYVAKGWTVIDMSSGYISTKSSIFVSWCAGEGNLRVIKGDITCTTTANEMYMFARWGKPGTYNSGTATSEIIIEGGNFHFTNKGSTLYTAVIGVKDTSSAVVTISGGNLDGGNYGVRALAGARLDLKVTGGTITACTATKDGTTQPGSVLYSAAKITNIIFTGGKAVATDASCNGINIKKGTTATIKMGGTASIDVKGFGIVNGSSDSDTVMNITITGGSISSANICILLEAPNGEMNVDIYAGVYSAVNGFLRIGANVKASIVNIYGGMVIQPFNAGGNVIYNTNTETTINLHGLTAFGGRTMITNKGKGTPSTKPGESFNATYSAGAPIMAYGAGVRFTEGSNGLRFVSTIDGDTVAALNALADEGTVSFGTLIFPASYLDGLTSYTHSTIPKYLDIAAKNGLVPDGNGGYAIRAAIVNLKTENYDRAFVAIAYVKYEVDGVLCYRYSALQQLQTARSMTQVARLALLDTKDVQDGSYAYESTVGEGFSKYTATQQALLTAYNPDLTVKTIDIYMITGQSNGSGYSHFGSEFKTDNTKYTAGFSNVLYSGLACSATGSNPLRWGTLTPVPTTAGFGRDGNYIGAELGLAEALSAYYNTETGKTAAILKYADGGTFLSDNVGGSSARQGNWTSPSYLAAHGKTDEVLSGNLYRNFIALVEDTVAYYQLLGYDVNLCGIFWMQGCSERNYYNGIPALGNEPAVASPTTEEVNALYTTLFQTMVADMRSDLGKIIGADLSAMPVVAGSISEAFGNIQSENQTNFVNMQAKMVSAENHTYLLSETRYLATGTDSGDSAHYSVDDMVFAGQKLGETFLTLGGHGSYIREPAEEDYVAMVVDGSDSTYYTNLAYAINTAPDGAVVYQLKDVNLYGPLNIATFSEGVTFEGNGFTIHSYSLGHSMKVIGAATNITLNDVRLINHRDNVNNAYAVYMYTGATLNITGNNTYFESYRYGIVVNLVSTVNISGGTFTTRNGQDIASAAVYVGSASTVNITGGTFTGVKNGAAFHINNAAATVTISGGTFTPGTSATYAINNASADATLTVDATVSSGTKGSVYNAGSGTATY